MECFSNPMSISLGWDVDSSAFLHEIDSECIVHVILIPLLNNER